MCTVGYTEMKLKTTADPEVEAGAGEWEQAVVLGEGSELDLGVHYPDGVRFVNLGTHDLCASWTLHYRFTFILNLFIYFLNFRGREKETENTPTG